MNDGRPAPRLLVFWLALTIAATPSAFAQQIAPPVESVISQASKTPAPTPFLTGGSRWLFPLCAKTVGLVAAQNQRVTQRVRQVAKLVGAPVAISENCNPNAEIVFSAHPQAFLDAVMDKRHRLLGGTLAQAKAAAVMRYPVQSWYSTAMMDEDGRLLLMPPDDDDCDPYCFFSMGHDTGLRTVIGTVIIVVDDDRVEGRKFDSLTDYIALMALTQARAFARCQAAPSIANLMAADCADVMQPDGLTAGDLAWMRGLYHMDVEAARKADEKDLALARGGN